MKLISLKKITDNMILAKDIGSDMGNILLPKGAQLKHNYAKRLQDWGIHSVYIEDNHMDQVEIDEELSEQTRDVVRRIVADFLDNTVGQLPKPVIEKIQEIMGRLLTDPNILPFLVEIKEFNENIFRHCVDGCILAVSFGTISGYDSKQLQELAMGAILSDLGKTGLSTHMSGDSGSLTVKERLEFQKHPELGSDMLRKLGNEYENSALAILQHHEQYDGTGFPKGLKGGQIHEYAKIIAIADSYLSSQAPGTEGQRMQPPQALQYIEEHSGTRFDPDFTLIFSQKIVPLIINRHEDPGNKGHNSSIDSVNTKKQDYPADSKRYKPDNQSYFSDSGHERPNNHRISGSDARHPSSKHQTTDDAKDPEISHERRQRMKDELFRIHESFLSKINTEPVPEQVLQVIRSIIDELVSSGGILDDFMTTNAVDAPGGGNAPDVGKAPSTVNPSNPLNSLNESNSSNARNALPAFNEKQLFQCMSVGVLAVMTGVSLGYTVEQLKELGTGTITLELEKTKLSKAGPGVLPTPDPGSVIEYTRIVFERLEQQKNNPNRQSISDFAKIAGLADIYSTITTQGIEGQSLMPHEVIEYIRDHGGGYFDPQLTRLFLQSIAPFLIGSFCLLNTGEKAKILKIHKDLLARPVIRVLVDSIGNKLAKPVEKDLEKDLTLFIVKTIQEDEL